MTRARSRQESGTNIRRARRIFGARLSKTEPENNAAVVPFRNGRRIDRAGL
jgi:hypothetical protein